MKIPDFDYTGHLPPYQGNPALSSNNMSPYSTSLLEVVKRFGHTKHRRNILKLFIQFREELYNSGISEGYQWIAGSFITQKEKFLGEEPGDVDVVTFYSVDKVVGEKVKADYKSSDGKHFLRRDYAKEQWKTDAFFINLHPKNIHKIIDDTRYWFGLFGHKMLTITYTTMVGCVKCGTINETNAMLEHNHWKGLLRINLDQALDHLALEEIERRERDEEANDKRDTAGRD